MRWKSLLERWVTQSKNTLNQASNTYLCGNEMENFLSYDEWLNDLILHIFYYVIKVTELKSQSKYILWKIFVLYFSNTGVNYWKNFTTSISFYCTSKTIFTKRAVILSLFVLCTLNCAVLTTIKYRVCYFILTCRGSVSNRCVIQHHNVCSRSLNSNP